MQNLTNLIEFGLEFISPPCDRRLITIALLYAVWNFITYRLLWYSYETIQFYAIQSNSMHEYLDCIASKSRQIVNFKDQYFRTSKHALLYWYICTTRIFKVDIFIVLSVNVPRSVLLYWNQAPWLKFTYKRAPAETTTNSRDVTNNARSRLQAVKYSDGHVPSKIATDISRFKWF